MDVFSSLAPAECQSAVPRDDERVNGALKQGIMTGDWFSELRSFVEVEVAVLGSQALKLLMVSVDAKQH